MVTKSHLEKSLVLFQPLPDFPLDLSVPLAMTSYFLPKVFEYIHLFTSEAPYHRPSYSLSMSLIDFTSSF